MFYNNYLHCFKVVFVPTTSSIYELLTTPCLKIEKESWHECVTGPSLHGKLTHRVDRGRSQVSRRNVLTEADEGIVRVDSYLEVLIEKCFPHICSQDFLSAKLFPLPMQPPYLKGSHVLVLGSK